jgi:hypothetical protein
MGVHWSRISPWIYYKENYNAADVLDQLASASNVAPRWTLQSAATQYKALRQNSSNCARKTEAHNTPLWHVLEIRRQQVSGDKGRTRPQR